MVQSLQDAMAQQLNVGQVMVPVNEVKISGTTMLYELMTRNGFFLPSLKSRFVTQKTLLLIRDGKLWSLK